MNTLKKTLKGKYFIEFPTEIIRITGLKEGDEIEFIPGGDISPRRQDIVLRKKD